MRRTATLPFTLRRKEEVLGMSSLTTTTETVHGLLRLDDDQVVLQWRSARKTEHLGAEIRTDQELDAVREVVLPLSALAGASRRRRFWDWLRGPRFVLTAADLGAFEGVAGKDGLSLDHPAELVVRIRRADTLQADEFAAELALALAERRLGPGEVGGAEAPRRFPSSDP
ncbi:MAG: hypothetical protein P8170_09310 [Gemmatimonadota bacterium]|jgi:hypothetical protein